MAEYLEDRWYSGFTRSPTFMDLYGNNASESLALNAVAAIDEFRKTQSIRILAANDSTFTETISNTYSQRGVLDNISQGILDKAPSALRNSAGMMQKIQSISYENALSTLTNFSSSGSLMDVVSGKLLGLQFSSPNTWQESSYASTLSLFIKLVSPSGDPASILRYITIPILTLMAAGSPLTMNGVTYGMPLVWDVRAYGISRFKVGALAALTISRGSYETVFNADKQPTVVDVRLTIVPLVQDFAVQYTKPHKGCTKTPKKDETQTDIVLKTIMDATSDSTQNLKNVASAATSGKDFNFMDAFTNLMQMVASSMGALTQCLGVEAKNMYRLTNLGVHSPSNEIEGLMGTRADIGRQRARMDPKYKIEHPGSKPDSGSKTQNIFTI
jgi:hypothetical protein